MCCYSINSPGWKTCCFSRCIVLLRVVLEGCVGRFYCYEEDEDDDDDAVVSDADIS